MTAYRAVAFAQPNGEIAMCACEITEPLADGTANSIQASREGPVPKGTRLRLRRTTESDGPVAWNQYNWIVADWTLDNAGAAVALVDLSAYVKTLRAKLDEHDVYGRAVMELAEEVSTLRRGLRPQLDEHAKRIDRLERSVAAIVHEAWRQRKPLGTEGA